jgi:hypothetical protein
MILYNPSFRAHISYTFLAIFFEGLPHIALIRIFEPGCWM